MTTDAAPVKTAQIKETRKEVRRRVRMEARKSVGLSRRQLATLCGWRGESRVANTEQDGTPFEDTARAMFYHLKKEAARQGVPFPYRLEMYL